jgi:hypothetical protein
MSAALVSLAVILIVAMVVAIVRRATARIGEGGPDHLSATRSLTDLIETAKVVHIIYVHGMRAEGDGASDNLAAMLKARLGFTDNKKIQETSLLTNESWPEGARFIDQPIWRSLKEWKASQPFVRRRSLQNAAHKRITITEVNWWPLLFPLKCRFILLPEHDLSGDDREHLRLFRRSDGRYYDWLDARDEARLRQPPKGGHAALFNRILKQQILNWGLTDAVIALGPMQRYFRKAICEAFDLVYKGAKDKDAFVIMSESLGSFVVLDAVALKLRPVMKILERTDDLYFFANQFSLLELGRLDLGATSTEKRALKPGAAATIDQHAPDSAEGSPLQALQEWAELQSNVESSQAKQFANTSEPLTQSPSDNLPRPRQVIAFSDPSDLLTYLVPKLDRVTVVNLFDRNAPRWLGLFANPIKAHTQHLANKRVWKVLTERRKPAASNERT